MLREAFLEIDMFLATFSDYAGAAAKHWTWTSSVGITHRLANVDHRVDLTTVRPDHRAVGGVELWHHRRRVCSHPSKSQRQRERFREMLQHTPCIDLGG